MVSPLVSSVIFYGLRGLHNKTWKSFHDTPKNLKKVALLFDKLFVCVYSFCLGFEIKIIMKCNGDGSFFFWCLKPPAEVWHIELHLMRIHESCDDEMCDVLMISKAKQPDCTPSRIHGIPIVLYVPTSTNTRQFTQLLPIVSCRKHTLAQQHQHLCLRIKCQHLKRVYFPKDAIPSDEMFFSYSCFPPFTGLYLFNGICCCWFLRIFFVSVHSLAIFSPPPK